jgi:hypothetical protein
VVERDRLQLGESLATISIAEDYWELVADEFAAALGQDRRTAKHARYYWLLLAQGYLTRQHFGTMLGRIAVLPLPNR